jgi:hypothetical protein
VSCIFCRVGADRQRTLTLGVFTVLDLVNHLEQKTAHDRVAREVNGLKKAYAYLGMIK